MKISVVTISYNQKRFLEQALRSVLDQEYPDLEYIVIDAGSNDGSRDIIERYAPRIDRVILEPDKGPADGLNKGFSVATGAIFGFLNSDDYLLPGALAEVARQFSMRPNVDVLSGHALVVDVDGKTVNRFYSRRFSLRRFVYGAAVLAQQSTFFRADAFRRAGGFNADNFIAWDGELWADLALAGATFGRINAFLSAFRIYPDSITGSGDHSAAYADYRRRVFKKVLNRDWSKRDRALQTLSKVYEYATHPIALIERLRKGPIVKAQTSD